MSNRAIDGSGNTAPVITASTYGSDLNRPGYPDESFVTGIREQLSDIISDISPTETPFYTKCGKESAKNTYTEWQTTAHPFPLPRCPRQAASLPGGGWLLIRGL